MENTLQLNITFETTFDRSNFLALNCMKLSVST